MIKTTDVIEQGAPREAEDGSQKGVSVAYKAYGGSSVAKYTQVQESYHMIEATDVIEQGAPRKAEDGPKVTPDVGHFMSHVKMAVHLGGEKFEHVSLDGISSQDDGTKRNEVGRHRVDEDEFTQAALKRWVDAMEEIATMAVLEQNGQTKMVIAPIGEDEPRPTR
ncbi:hypothetical protein BKA70DRAFT_1215090 [Coprinopsis sp. MPI-PUGE-AT-0042]|nr:hypothetical protein BKA70DRAFT_1215090 [Coprinopsis sp. MPI-PUGE-AT-0042]